ncbi:sulfite exporter TauE/SafE family protein [Hahella sp. SMD15-11]|uniref:Sulfite exporter TauE/SafE family protein n=1 Tax=Thermohahella caldifontis TaxID=3142973 RepID=A0AB39UZC3_9GAMM
MTEQLVSAMLIGLLGSPHCLGMCGGLAALAASRDHPHPLARTCLLHGSRLLSYATLGLAGGFLGASLQFSPLAASVARGLAGIMLILMGLYLSGWWQGLRHLERIGGQIWQRIRPRGRTGTWRHTLLLGLSWGLLPCGLVYSTLIWSVALGDPHTSPAVMLAFGVGTLPSMMGASLFSVSLRRFLARKGVRLAGAFILVLSGIWTLLFPIANTL